MPAPTSQDIRRKALELYYAIPAHVGLPPPEDVELKDRNLWREAQIGLMRGSGVEVGESIRKGVETPPIATKEYLDYLKGELDKLEGMIREVKATPKRRKVSERIRTMRIIEQVGEKQEALSLLLEREPLLERAQAGDPLVLNWLEARGLRVDDLEAEVEYLRRVVADPPQEEMIRPMILRNHTEVNIVSLSTYVQTEGVIGYTHAWRRVWTPYVGLGMGKEEPVEYTARLITAAYFSEEWDGISYRWVVKRGKAVRLLELTEPYLIADKQESARYILTMTRTLGRLSIRDIEYRPMYIGLVERKIVPIFLYEEYVKFPIKYAKIVRRGEELPKPYSLPLVLRYTPDRIPILWREGLKYE